MPLYPSHPESAVEVAVRGAGLGPVPGIVLGAAPGRGRLARPRVALAIRAPSGDEWTPFVASAHQILMTWERWCALRRAALAEHPWPEEAVRRVVELLPDGTRRVLPRDAIGVRCAFVVDASKAMHVITTTLLTIAGFSVETFATPAAALQRAVDRRPDVVVMEPRSPGLDAISTMRALRQLGGDQAAPVVWCTTVVPSLEHVDEGARLGLRGVILKPLRLEALRALVLRVCHDAERESRLRALGVSASHIASRSLDREETRLWAQVETELVADPPLPLSVVRVGGGSAELMAAVRGSIRAGDMVGRAPDGSLLVLLPGVGEAGATAVAERITRAVSAMEHRPAVDCVTGSAGGDVGELLVLHVEGARTVMDTGDGPALSPPRAAGQRPHP